MSKIEYGDYKLGLVLLKYIPIIMFFIMWIHTGLLVFNIDGPCAEPSVPETFENNQPGGPESLCLCRGGLQSLG